MNIFEGGEIGEETFNAFNPKFGLDGTEVRGVFKPPRVPSGLNPPGVDPTLDPEDITNYEVGLKSSFLDGRASLQATYFNMERDGVVVRTQVGPLFIDSNAGKQDFEGVELGAAWAPMPNLSFFGNVAFYHNRYGQFPCHHLSR